MGDFLFEYFIQLGFLLVLTTFKNNHFIMKKIYSFLFVLSFVFLFQTYTANACPHFLESFTGTTFPTSYGSGSATLGSGIWDYQQLKVELAANAYGGSGGAVRLAKSVANAYLIAPSVNTIGTISLYYRALNTGSGTFKVQKSVNGGAYTDIATQAFNSQTYALFTITINDASNNIRIKILSDNNPENLILDEVNITNYDITPPVVFANAQTVANTGQSAIVQSNEAYGFVYIIKDGIAQTTLADLNTAVTNLQGAKTAVTAANTDINVSALNLQIGNYYAYAVDCSNNISTKGTNIIQVIASAATISGVAFGNGNYKIGSVIPVTITAGGTGYTAGTITINGRAATGFTDNGNNTYSVVYTVQEGDADRASAAVVPISVVLYNGATPSAAFTGPATGTITIDANRPLVTASQRNSNTEIKLTTNELLAAATITQSNDGGFIVTDRVTTSTHYTVSAVHPGASNSEIILTLADFGASALTGLAIQYTWGGNGILTDVAGNNLMTNYSIIPIDPWGSPAIISGVAFGNGNYKIGSVIPVTITAGGTGYTAGAITINGHAATGFTDNGNSTYSVVYTVQDGDADRASAAVVPISVVLYNGATPSAAFTGPATGTITIDANRPVLTASQRNSNTEIKLTTNELLAAATITRANDGGFVVTDRVTTSTHYTVTAVNPGASNSEIILTVADFGASALTGLAIQYTWGTNGIVADVAGNNLLSNSSITPIDPWSSPATISGVAFGNGNYKIGSAIPVTITAGGTGYTVGAITINGHAATGFTDNGNSTYSVVYTVQEGDADRASAAAVPISVVLYNGATPSAAFTGPATGTITIDANRPVVTVSQRNSNTEIKLTTNELLAASTITQANDGGFIVTDLFNTSIHYTVTAINPGSSNAEIILTVNDFIASSVVGLSVQYTAGGNGNITDAAGNAMVTTLAIPDINPWSGVGIFTSTDLNEQLGIYPNPASDYAAISYVSLETHDVSIEMINCIGQTIISKSLNAIEGNNNVVFDLSGINGGVYYIVVRAKDGKFIQSKKLIIK